MTYAEVSKSVKVKLGRIQTRPLSSHAQSMLSFYALNRKTTLLQILKPKMRCRQAKEDWKPLQ